MLCFRLILGTAAHKAGKGSPSSRQRQLYRFLSYGCHLACPQSPPHWRPLSKESCPGFHLSAVTVPLLSHHLSSLHLPPSQRHCEQLSTFQAPNTISACCSRTTILPLALPGSAGSPDGSRGLMLCFSTAAETPSPSQAFAQGEGVLKWRLVAAAAH